MTISENVYTICNSTTYLCKWISELQLKSAWASDTENYFAYVYYQKTVKAGAETASDKKDEPPKVTSRMALYSTGLASLKSIDQWKNVSA